MSPSRPTSQGGSTTSTIPDAAYGPGGIYSLQPAPVEPIRYYSVGSSGKTAAGLMPQRVIPDKCEYAQAKYIPGAPSPVGNLAPAHDDLRMRAEKEIRQYVCSRFRDWPICAPSNRPVDVTLLEGFDPDRGEVLRGAFICPECSKR